MSESVSDPSRWNNGEKGKIKERDKTWHRKSIRGEKCNKILGGYPNGSFRRGSYLEAMVKAFSFKTEE